MDFQNILGRLPEVTEKIHKDYSYDFKHSKSSIPILKTIHLNSTTSLL